MPRPRRRPSSRRLVALAAACALVAGACGDDGSDVASGQGAPVVEIVEVNADGAAATIAYRVDDDGASVLVSVDWGDGSPQEEFRGIGDLSATHSYGEGVVDPLVTIVAIDDDGNTVRAGRTVVLGSAAPTTSVPPESSNSSTSTPAESSTTSTTTTTSLPPEAFEQVVVLEPGDARVLYPEGPGGGSRGSVDGSNLELSAVTEGVGGAAEDIVMDLHWEFPPDDFAILGDEPDVDVRYTGGLEVQLDTGNNRGRSASVEANLGASDGVTPANELILEQQIGRDADFADTYPDPVGFSTTWRAGPDGVGPFTVYLTLRCSVTPGETLFQVGEESRCEVSGSPTVTVTVTRTQIP